MVPAGRGQAEGLGVLRCCRTNTKPALLPNTAWLKSHPNPHRPCSRSYNNAERPYTSCSDTGTEVSNCKPDLGVCENRFLERGPQLGMECCSCGEPATQEILKFGAHSCFSETSSRLASYSNASMLLKALFWTCVSRWCVCALESAEAIAMAKTN